VPREGDVREVRNIADLALEAREVRDPVLEKTAVAATARAACDTGGA